MSNTRKSNVYRMTGLAILSAIIIVLQVFTTFVRFGPFSITLALIPIVVGAAMYGVGAGAYLGAVFSAVVIIMCITGGDVGGFMVWSANPFMCIVMCTLKGTMAGLCAEQAARRDHGGSGLPHRQHRYLHHRYAVVFQRDSGGMGRRLRSSVLHHPRSYRRQLPHRARRQHDPQPRRSKDNRRGPENHPLITKAVARAAAFSPSHISTDNHQKHFSIYCVIFRL